MLVILAWHSDEFTMQSAGSHLSAKGRAIGRPGIFVCLTTVPLRLPPASTPSYPFPSLPYAYRFPLAADDGFVFHLIEHISLYTDFLSWCSPPFRCFILVVPLPLSLRSAVRRPPIRLSSGGTYINIYIYMKIKIIKIQNSEKKE